MFYVSRDFSVSLYTLKRTYHSEHNQMFKPVHHVLDFRTTHACTTACECTEAAVASTVALFGLGSSTGCKIPRTDRCSGVYTGTMQCGTWRVVCAGCGCRSVFAVLIAGLTLRCTLQLAHTVAGTKCMRPCTQRSADADRVLQMEVPLHATETLPGRSSWLFARGRETRLLARLFARGRETDV